MAQGEDAEENRAQGVNVRPSVDFSVFRGLLGRQGARNRRGGACYLGRLEGESIFVGRLADFGEAPMIDEYFPKPAEDHRVGLQ